MSTTCPIRNVAIVGASGNLGEHITASILAKGIHRLTAITRADGGSHDFLPGVTIRRVDYGRQESLVRALRGQDALIITLSGRAQIQQVEENLIRAAGEAGVRWILPNEWAPDSAHEGLVKDMPMLRMKVTTRNLIASLGKSSYIAVVTGFWYEYNMALPGTFGFDYANRSMTFFDDGQTLMSTSTWPQIGRAVASLISLPLTSLASLRNKVVYVSSFTLTQRDLFASVLRVTHSRPSDWNITSIPARERFAAGLQEIAALNFAGYVKLPSRLFFPDGSGNFATRKAGTLNAMLDLPQEDLDELTSFAMETVKEH